MQRRGVDVVGRLSVFTQITSVAFDCLVFVVPHTFRVGLDEAAIEDASGETFVIVCFNCFEIMNGNSSLIADLAQANATLLASESQLFAYARSHLQSLDSWCRVGRMVNPGLSLCRLLNRLQLPLFLHYSLRC